MITQQLLINAAHVYEEQVCVFSSEFSSEIYVSVNGAGLVEETLMWEIVESDDLLNWGRVGELFYEALNSKQEVKLSGHDKRFLAFRVLEINEEVGGQIAVIVESK